MHAGNLRADVGRSARASRARGRWLLFALLVCIRTHAQDTQILPEIDAHLTFNSHVRAYLQALDDRDGGDPTQFTFGPSIEIFLRPWLRLKHVTLFDLDDAKSRPLVGEFGYRIITAPDTAPKHRLVESVTFHYPVGKGVLLYDKNRADTDWQNGDFTWRYRNKLTIERTFSILSYHFIPHLAAEPFYTSQYNKWSTTSLYAGSLFPAGKHMQFDAYYEHENDTGMKPNRQNHYIGLVLNLYFSLARDVQSPPIPHKQNNKTGASSR